MNKNLILESAYETIKESLEWGLDCEDKTYANYVDGVVNMTETMLKKIEKEDQEVLERAKSFLETCKHDCVISTQN